MWPLAVRRWQSRKTLAGVAAPTRVCLAARVASGEEHSSPVTGFRAAVVHWAVFAENVMDRRGNTRSAMYTPVSSGLLGGELVLEAPGGRVTLPWPGFELRFYTGTDYGELLTRSLPPGWLPARHSAGLLYYRELLLRQGDAVRLTAVVARGARGSAYRSASTAEFVAQYDREPAVVEDLTRNR